MAGKSKAKTKKSQSKRDPKEKKGPTSPTSGQKLKSLTELHGVEKFQIQTPNFSTNFIGTTSKSTEEEGAIVRMTYDHEENAE